MPEIEEDHPAIQKGTSHGSKSASGAWALGNIGQGHAAVPANGMEFLAAPGVWCRGRKLQQGEARSTQ